MSLTDRNGLTEEQFLASYNADQYERPSVAADMVIFTVAYAEESNYRKLPDKELKVLLIMRGGHPFLGKWALPGGFVRPNETTEQAARRELREETAVDHGYLEQLFSDPNRDPRTWVMSCAYMALIDSYQLATEAGDDADETAWFNVLCRLTKETKVLTSDGSIVTKQFELKLESERHNLTSIVERVKTTTDKASSVEYAIVANDGLAFDHAISLPSRSNGFEGKWNIPILR